MNQIALLPTQDHPNNSHLMRYVVLENLFSPQECEQIVHLNLPVGRGEVNHYSGEDSRLETTERNALTKAIPKKPEHEWIYNKVTQAAMAINKAQYGFDIQGILSPEVLEYQNTGFYKAHADIGVGRLSSRKLTLVVFLSPSHQYAGGRLRLHPDFADFPQEQGSLVCFPSYIPHEVEPVTSGIRHVLVSWIIGNAFQ